MSKVRVFIIAKGIYILRTHINYHKRPYHIESTPSRPIWEVKQCRARLVRWWETTLEVLVSLLTFLRRTGCIGKTHHLSIILLRQKLVKCSFLFYFFPPRQKLVKCFHFCLHRSGYSLVRPFVPPSFLPLLCLPTPALALVFITPFLVFACRAHTPAISFPVVSLSFSSFASTPHVPHSGSLSCPTSFAVPSSLSSPPPLRRRLCFPSPPSSFCCLFIKPSRTPFFLCPWLSHPPASIAVVQSASPAHLFSFRRACRGHPPLWTPLFLFALRSSFLCVCFGAFFLSLCGVGGVAKPRRRAKAREP